MTLLEALLGEIGVKSYYVLMNSERGVVAPGVPSVQAFDHVIAAIALPAGAEAAAMPAVIHNERLGDLLLFDPTDSRTPLGSLPPEEQASTGLLVYDEGGAAITTPLEPPSQNRLLRMGQFKLSADGTLSGQVTELRWGAPAVEMRASLTSAQGMDRARVLEDILGGIAGRIRDE